ncbi:MAG TPA: phosphate transport system regulatory protein PhoU [Chloroflexi bacterium]|nr:phosphate transport system regulatory protein PhoU [Chloroflexota bacterium]HAF19374.1 phosphate transport system regulatory protein PhoU [Chloroflexota bacterium]
MTDDVLLELGRLVGMALTDALIALDRHDLALADKVVRGDLEINRLRYQLEEQITPRLAGSEAADARWMVAALYVISELERMGDHAEGIAKVTLMLGPNPSLSVPAVIGDMGSLTISMVGRALAALNKRDVKAARAVCREDDEIDALYDRAYQELISMMVSDPRRITEATYMIWVTHNLERIADRATNICERVVYLATGHVEELNVSKY